MPKNSTIKDRIIAIGWNSLSSVSAVDAFEMLLTNVDCAVSGRTITLLKNNKFIEKIKHLYLLMKVLNADLFVLKIIITYIEN